MMSPSDSDILKKFRDSVDRGSFPEDMKVTFRIAGGLPDQRLEEEVTLSGRGEAEVKAMDMLESKPTEKVHATLPQEEIQAAFQKIKLSLDSMVPRSEACFLPDSVVGSVVIEIGDEKTTMFFPVDSAEKTAGREAVPSPVSDAIIYFKRTSKRLIEAGGEK